MSMCLAKYILAFQAGVIASLLGLLVHSSFESDGREEQSKLRHEFFMAGYGTAKKHYNFNIEPTTQLKTTTQLDYDR